MNNATKTIIAEFEALNVRLAYLEDAALDADDSNMSDKLEEARGHLFDAIDALKR
jgi:hypothetical protein